MTDEEILTKRLSDWKPETDIRLQKAFGKFVEEAGELSEATNNFKIFGARCFEKEALEAEIADCLAFIEVISVATGGEVSLNPPGYDPVITSLDFRLTGYEFIHSNVMRYVSRVLTIIGRCQIQGIAGKQPESAITNVSILEGHLYNLRTFLELVVSKYDFDQERIERRKQAKIDSKLPWVMGTATDLFPST